VSSKLICSKSAKSGQFFNYIDFLGNGAPIENIFKKTLLLILMYKRRISKFISKNFLYCERAYFFYLNLSKIISEL